MCTRVEIKNLEVAYASLGKGKLQAKDIVQVFITKLGFAQNEHNAL